MRYKYLLLVFLFNICHAEKTTLICNDGGYSYLSYGAKDWVTVKKDGAILISFDETTQEVEFSNLVRCSGKSMIQKVEIHESVIHYQCDDFGEPDTVIESTSASWVLNRYSGELSWSKFNAHKNGKEHFTVMGGANCELSKRKF